jgi:hypothetical protein
MTEDSLETTLLTEGQRRHLTTILAQIENHLHEIVALTTGARSPAPRLLRNVVHDLPRSFGEATSADISAAHRTMAELVGTFDLGAAPVSTRQAVQALVAHALVIVEDAASRRLRSYGPVHPDLPPLLDPLLGRLHGQFLSLARILPEPAGERSASAQS